MGKKKQRRHGQYFYNKPKPPPAELGGKVKNAEMTLYESKFKSTVPGYIDFMLDNLNMFRETTKDSDTPLLVTLFIYFDIGTGNTHESGTFNISIDEEYNCLVKLVSLFKDYDKTMERLELETWNTDYDCGSTSPCVAHPSYYCDGGCGKKMGEGHEDDCKRICSDCDEDSHRSGSTRIAQGLV